MKKRILWELPTLNVQGDLGEHRKVSWLELFFDLFFVVSIAQLAAGLSANPTLRGLGEFVFLFIPVWWVWIGFTYYTERFESNGLESRLFTFLLMLTVIGLAVFSRRMGQDGWKGFLLSYAAARVLIIALWSRASFHSKAFRPVGVRYNVGFGASVVMTCVAAFEDRPFAQMLFGCALLVDLITPMTTISLQEKLPRFSTSKLPERYGLFVLVVLGEMVVGVVNGLAQTNAPSADRFVEAALGVGLGFGLWWIYFDSAARRPPKPRATWVITWGYFHLPFVMAIAATGAGISSVIGKEGVPSAEVRQLVATALGSALVSLALIEGTLQRAEREDREWRLGSALKLLAGALSFAFGWGSSIENSRALLLLLLALIAVPATHGVVTLFKKDETI